MTDFPAIAALPAGFPLPLAALIAALSGLVLALVLGGPTIRWLSARGLQDGKGRKASDTLNELNAGKAKTPTMGGLFVLAAIVAAALLLLPFDSPLPWIVLGAAVANGALGAVDDWAKLRGRKGDGLRARTKLAAQVVIALACAVAFSLTLPEGSLELVIPGAGVSLPLGVLFMPFAVAVMIGTGNAVNLSDGLDGLAGGMLVLAFGALGLAALAVGSEAAAAYLHVPYVEGSSAVGLLLVIAAGACCGFLWFNVHPASVFMGDTGSLALGAGLGAAAVAIRQELLLFVVGAVFVAEAMSVMLQVGFFKATKGKRLFRCAPLHHHFQFGGWKETKVTLRFWLLAALFAISGLALFALPALAGAANSAQVQTDSNNPTAAPTPDRSGPSQEAATAELSLGR